MRRRAALFGAGLAAAATMLTASPAQAQEVCVGPPRNVYVCVDPAGMELIRHCVHTGSGMCGEVVVAGPTVECGGDFGERICDAFSS